MPNPHQLFSICTTAIAVTFNVILLFFIVFHSTERLGSYKYLIFAYTLNATFFTSCQFLILENWVVPKDRAGYLFYSTVQLFPRWVQTWTITAFIGFFHLNLFIVCWSFLYRLTIISQSFFFEKRWKVGLLTALTVFLEALTIFNGWLIHPTEKSELEYREIVFNITGRPIEEVGYIGGPFKYGNDLNVNLAVALSINGSANFCVNVFIIYCWLGIRRRLAEKRRSSLSHRIHYRLYILLTLQSLFPVIFNSTPVIIAFSFSALHIDIGNYLLLCGDVMNLAQIADPICIVFFVSDYKRSFLKLFCPKRIYASRIGPTTLRFSHQTTDNENRVKESVQSSHLSH